MKNLSDKREYVFNNQDTLAITNLSWKNDKFMHQMNIHLYKNNAKLIKY